MCPQSPRLLKLDLSWLWKHLFIRMFLRLSLKSQVRGYQSAVCTAMRTEFSSSSWGCMAPGAQLWLQPYLCVRTTHRHCSWGCPGAHEPGPSGRRHKGSFLRNHSWLQSSSLLFPLAASQSQQQPSPWICSPNPTFQHPAPDTHLRVGHTGHRMDHLCRSHCVLPATHWLLHSPLSTPSVPADLPTSEGGSFHICGNLSSPLATPPPPRSTSSFLHPFLFLWSYLVILGMFLILLSVWGPLLEFSSYFVRFVPLLDVFLIHLWWDVSSMSSSCHFTPVDLIW